MIRDIRRIVVGVDISETAALSAGSQLAVEQAQWVALIESQLPKALFEAAELHIALTSPSHAILTCADRLKPDLVVMGTISRAGIAGLAVGNTAERILSHLDCSLLTVKPGDFVCPVQLAEL